MTAIMDLQRVITKQITDRMAPGKAMLLFGARRVGKTKLLKQIVENFNGNSLILNGEDNDVQALLSNKSAAHYKSLFSDIDLLAIDEAQNVPDIGAKIKFIVDEIPSIRVIATGSSAFDLSNKAGEPLVGRSSTFMLTPFAFEEMYTGNPVESVSKINERLVYGSYPDVVKAETLQEKQEYLKDMVSAYLLKDILTYDGVKNSSKMIELLRLIAYQVGSEVSNDELGRQLGISKNTVEKYLDLLSKVYIIYRLGGYSRNLRKEISKTSKWYFHDNGIRNAIIGDFKPVEIRQDTGILWENYIISERVKLCANHKSGKEFYFWRTYDQQEIDLLELDSNELQAYEIKSGDKTPKCPVAFAGAYPDVAFSVINRENFIEHLLGRG